MVEIKIRQDGGGHAVAALSGELRADGADDFSERLHPLVAERGARLAVDLSSVDQIDSAGLSCLLNLGARAKLSGGRVILVGPQPKVAGVLEITHLDTWFEIVDNLDEAARRMAGAESS